MKKIKIRNAFAVPAKARRNAGAHTHKQPPRGKFSNFTACETCGAPVFDGKALCEECEADAEAEELSIEESSFFIFNFPSPLAYQLLTLT